MLDAHLAGREYIADEFSIADIACYPACEGAIRNGESLASLANVTRWMQTMEARPAVAAAMDKGRKLRASA